MAGNKTGSARFFPEVGAARAKSYLTAQGKKPGSLHLLEARRQTNGKVFGTLVVISDKAVPPAQLYKIAERFREQIKKGEVSKAGRDMVAAAASGDFTIQRAVPQRAATAGRPPVKPTAGKKSKPKVKPKAAPAKPAAKASAKPAAKKAGQQRVAKKMAAKKAPAKKAGAKKPAKPVARRSSPELPPPMPSVHPDYEQQLLQQSRIDAELQSVGLRPGVSGYPVRTEYSGSTEPVLTANGYVIGTGVDLSLAPSRPQDAYDWSYGGAMMSVGTIGAPAVEDNFDHAWARFVEQTRAGINRSTGHGPVAAEIVDGVGGYTQTDWYP